MKRTKLEAWAVRHGYAKDRHGHFVKEVVRGAETSKYRLHISQNACRKELRGNGCWIRLRSGYLKNLTLDAEDKLCGLRAEGCKGFPSSAKNPND